MTGVEDRRFEEARHKIQWSGDVLSMRNVRVAACNGVFLDRNTGVAGYQACREPSCLPSCGPS